MSDPVERRIRLGTGLSYNILEWSCEKAPTLVLIHGFLDSAWGWRALADELKDHFHLVAPDMRGHGDSDPAGPGAYYHFPNYLADLHCLIKELGRESVSLVGHSMGGTICSLYAGTYPEAIDKLVLLEGLGPPEGTLPLPERTASWLDAWPAARAKQNRPYPDVESAAAQMRRYDKRLKEPMSLELARRGTTQSDDGVRFKHDPVHRVRGPYPFSFEAARQFWTRITCPTLLVDAAQTEMRLSDDDAARRRACIPHAHTQVIEDAGHMMQRHQPKTLAETLARFLLE